jgi:hypothetical protein
MLLSGNCCCIVPTLAAASSASFFSEKVGVCFSIFFCAISAFLVLESKSAKLTSPLSKADLRPAGLSIDIVAFFIL